MINPFICWGAISAGTFLFLGVLAVSAFKHGGIEKFRKLNISFTTLVIVLVLMSIAFPFAWNQIHKLVKEQQ